MVLSFLSAIAALFLTPASGHATDALIVSSADDLTVTAEVNGRPLRLLVDSGMAGLTLNPAGAAAAGLTGSPSARAQIGPVRLTGQRAQVRVQIAGRHFDQTALWFETNVVDGAHGVIGMAELPFAQVTAQLRAPHAGEREWQLAAERVGSMGLRHQQKIGRPKVGIVFRLSQPFSQATASAGAHLAAEHGGTWAGDPFERPVLLGVPRPLRPMRFARPPLLAGLPVPDLLIRTSDFRGRYVLPSDPSADPNEIVVTGNVQRSEARLVVMLGRDLLTQACSSISYERDRRRTTLRCS